MQYGIGRFALIDGGSRYSVSHTNLEIKDLLNDSKYNDNLKFEGFTVVYGFYADDNQVITQEQKMLFGVEMMTANEFKNWLKNNTTYEWKSENEVILQEYIPETDGMMGEVPELTLTIQ